MQARSRVHLPLPPGPRRATRIESEYVRGGTLAYLLGGFSLTERAAYVETGGVGLELVIKRAYSSLSSKKSSSTDLSWYVSFTDTPTS